MGGPAHRVRQFTRAVATERRWLGSDRPLDEAARVLSPAELGLFARLSPSDRQHSLDVLRRLQRDGHDDSHLLRAALLHDVGKAEAPIAIWHRVAFVLVGAVSPVLLGWLSSRPTSWRRPFHVIRWHAELGAGAAEVAGSPTEVVWLIRHHEDPGSHPLGQLLRAYDSSG